MVWLYDVRIYMCVSNVAIVRSACNWFAASTACIRSIFTVTARHHLVCDRVYEDTCLLLMADFPRSVESARPRDSRLATHTVVEVLLARTGARDIYTTVVPLRTRKGGGDCELKTNKPSYILSTTTRYSTTCVVTAVVGGP